MFERNVKANLNVDLGAARPSPTDEAGDIAVDTSGAPAICGIDATGKRWFPVGGAVGIGGPGFQSQPNPSTDPFIAFDFLLGRNGYTSAQVPAGGALCTLALGVTAGETFENITLTHGTFCEAPPNAASAEARTSVLVKASGAGRIQGVATLANGLGRVVAGHASLTVMAVDDPAFQGAAVQFGGP